MYRTEAVPTEEYEMDRTDAVPTKEYEMDRTDAVQIEEYKRTNIEKEVENTNDSYSYKSFKRKKCLDNFYVICCLLTLSCLMTVLVLVVVALKSIQTPSRCRSELDYIDVGEYTMHPLPNNNQVFVLNKIFTITDANGIKPTNENGNQIEMRDIVYMRIVKYLYKELSNQSNRCSPWVVDTFYPNDNLAITHCMHNKTFSFRIKDELNKKSISFYTDMTPFSVDLFLKQFDEASNI